MSAARASSARLWAAILSLTLATGCDGPVAPGDPPAAPAALPDVTVFADQRLDDADAAIEKAIALLQAAENPSAPNPKRPFGGHDLKAVRHLEAARSEIAAAKAFADGTN